MVNNFALNNTTYTRKFTLRSDYYLMSYNFMSAPGAFRRAESYKTPRNIAAPFQTNSNNENGISSHSPVGKNGENEMRYEFPPLEDLSQVTYDKV